MMFLLPISLFSSSFDLSFDAYSDLKPQHGCTLEPIFSFFFPGASSGFISILFISRFILFFLCSVLLLLSHLGVIIFAACFTTFVSDIFVTFFYHLVIILRPLKQIFLLGADVNLKNVLFYSKVQQVLSIPKAHVSQNALQST
jgi:hypothetical protein